MKGSKIKSISILLALTSVITFSAPSFANENDAYWHETKAVREDNKFSDWMGSVDGNKRVSELSIPGTHDSLAYGKMPVPNIAKTQTMDLIQQLNSGIRYFDVRVAHEGDHFQLYHGSIRLGSNLSGVLTTFGEFLKDHPTETVLMRFKQEHTHANDEQMRELFNKYMEEFGDLFWNPDESSDRDNPTLDELRGKICLISDVLSITNGINYRNLDIQDNYHLRTNWQLYDKWNDVKNQINRANSDSDNAIVLNYLSGSGGSFPYFVASGKSSSGTYAPRLLTGLTEPGFRRRYPDFPRVGRWGIFASIAFEGTNELSANYILNNNIRHTGIVAADFPGEKLINSIINLNY